MDERISKVLATIDDFERLEQFEVNVRRQKANTSEVEAAIKARAAYLARTLITERTGIALANLTSAEEGIVQAVSEYVGVMKHKGKDATRTLLQLKNRGLIGAAEAAVSKARPTQGFQTLNEEGLEDLSYEQIILDHPEEFSPRATWFASRTLGRPTDGDRPPARTTILAQLRTEDLLAWLKMRASEGDGSAGHFTNADAARAISMNDLRAHGRVFGNVQSRLDFACYRLGLPPLGLVAEAPFDDAWSDEQQSWKFPVSSMQRAAKAFRWRDHDFDRLLSETVTLSGQAHVLWEAELRDHGPRVRAWAEGLEGGPHESASPVVQVSDNLARNPDWTREEHILGLDLYLRLHETSYPKDHPEVIKLSEILQALAKLRGTTGGPTFRNANGVSMKMLNFRRFDPSYDGTGLPSGSKLEEEVWGEYADRPEALATEVRSILDEIYASTQEQIASSAPGDEALSEVPYWVLVCNPAKWAIDKFLAGGIDVDTWGVRPSDADKFAPGQLAIVRVGVDRRSAVDRLGRPPLEPGIYALCEVESTSFRGTGATDSFWAEGEGREPGWPTVRVRYLRGYLQNPLTIALLRASKPNLSNLLLNGFQAASFPISADDFHAVLEMLGEDPETLAAPTAWPPPDTFDRLADLERKYLNASPEVKSRTSSSIERGPLGREVKKAMGHRCQLCAAIGMNPIGFLKANGDPYVEAHHVMPVSRKQVGSLSASNIMTVCPNHHRQIHYGADIDVKIGECAFSVSIGGVIVEILKFNLAFPNASVSEPVHSRAQTGT
ncbi:EVE domain-containing protein [Rhodospirillales bacterium URHD0017]|nr:EVE domain-containing protein [Rhodospirillales bacterium URHD0017]